MEVFILIALVVLAILGKSQIDALKRRIATMDDELGRLRKHVKTFEPSDDRPASAPEYRPSAPETSPTPSVSAANFGAPPPIAASPVVPAPIEIDPASDRPPVPAALPARPPALPLRPVARREVEPHPSPGVPRNPEPAQSATTLEESIGTRLTTWIGGIAIALAGALMVKYFHDKGLIGPEARLSIAGLVGLLLIAVSEPLRRKKLVAAEATAASGVAVLYAVVLAAANLYDLISFRTAFVANAIVTAGAVLLALRHGAFVAILALVGGLLMPQLLAREIPEIPTIVPYLAILEAGLVWLARKKNWWWLQALLTFGAFVWWILLLSATWRGSDSHWVAIYAIFATGMFTYSILPRPGEKGGLLTLRGVIGLIGLVMSFLMLLACTAKTDFSASEWAYVGLACVGMSVFERLRKDARWIAIFVEVPTLFLILGFAAAMEAADAPLFGRVALAFGLIFSPLNLLFAFGHARPADFAWRSLFLSVGLFIVAYANHFVYRPPMPWWAIAGIGAVAHGAFSAIYRSRGATYASSADITAVGALVFVVLLEFLKLEKTIEPIVVCATGFAAIEAARRLEFPKSRAVAVATILLGLVVLMLQRAWWSGLVDAHPIFNQIAPTFLITIAIAAVAGDREIHAGRKVSGSLLIGASIFATVIFIEVFVRNALGLAQRIPDVDRPSFEAMAIIAPILAAFGFLLTKINRPALRELLSTAGIIVAAIGVYLPLVALISPYSPLARRVDVGSWPIANLLFTAFAIPAGFAIAMARRNSDSHRNVAPAFLFPALALGFLFVSGIVRHAFHGSSLGVTVTSHVTPYYTSYATDYARPGSREYLLYSMSWIAYAVILLVAGVKTKSGPVRWCSLFFMLVAVLKVFLSDLAELRDLARVFSFFGLGVTLLGLSWVYQRFVFVKGAKDQRQP